MPITESTCLILGAGGSAPYGLPTAGQLRSLILSSKINDVDTARKFPVAGDGSIDWNRPYNVARRWKQERAIFLSGFVDDAHQLENFRESFCIRSLVRLVPPTSGRVQLCGSNPAGGGIIDVRARQQSPRGLVSNASGDSDFGGPRGVAPQQAVDHHL